LVWSAAAFACTFAANHKCDFIKIYDSRQTDEVMTRGLWKGMWTLGSECTSYKEGGFYIDRHWNSARAASVIVDILACFALLASCAATMPQSRNAKTIGAVTSITVKACLFQGLTLLFLTSSACTSKTGISASYTVCELSQAGNLSIAATVLWFMASLTSCCTGAMAAAKSKGGEPVPESGPESE
jgi:hypothetical protein